MITLRQQLAELQQQLDLSIQASKATLIIEKCGVVLSKTETVAGHYGCLKFHLELSLLKSKGAKPGVQSPSETNASFSSVPGTAFGMMR